MSDRKLDELSKALATTTSRRQMLKVLAATAVGGAVSLAGARRRAGWSMPQGRSAVPCQLRVLRLLLPAQHRQVRLPAGREPVREDEALHQLRPRGDVRPGHVPVHLPGGDDAVRQRVLQRRRGVLPRRLLRPDMLPSGRDLLPGRLLLVLRGPVLET